MDSKPVSIVTSKAAQDDLNRIRLEHGEIVQGIKAHQERMALSKQDNFQNALQRENQNREFDLKERALTTKQYGRY